MKLKYLIFLFTLSIFLACHHDEIDLFEITPEGDLIALEGMEEAYERALLFNDSLITCSNESMDCDLATITHYDELFHQFEEMFNTHHSNYSHNNIEDDHHHELNRNIRHGSMMNHDEDEDEDEHGYEHNMETFERMMDLIALHEEIHPG